MTNVEFTSDVVRSATFREKLKGYNPEDVHAFMERSASAIDQLTARLGEASARALKAEAALASNSEADESVRRTLVLAQRTAEMAVREANDEAATIRSDARREADELLEGARAHAAELQADASSRAAAMTGEAGRIHAEADAHATATVADADTYTTRVRAEADARAAAILADAEAKASARIADAEASAAAVDATVEAEFATRRAEILEEIEQFASANRQETEDAIAALRAQHHQLWADVETLGGYLATERARILEALRDSVDRFGETLAPAERPDVAPPIPAVRDDAHAGSAPLDEAGVDRHDEDGYGWPDQGVRSEDPGRFEPGDEIFVGEYDRDGHDAVSPETGDVYGWTRGPAGWVAEGDPVLSGPQGAPAETNPWGHQDPPDGAPTDEGYHTWADPGRVSQWDQEPAVASAWDPSGARPAAGWADAAAFRPEDETAGGAWTQPHAVEPEPAWGQPIESGYGPGWAPDARTTEPAWEWPGRADPETQADPGPAAAWFGPENVGAEHAGVPAGGPGWPTDAWDNASAAGEATETPEWGTGAPAEAEGAGAWGSTPPTPWTSWSDVPAAVLEAPRDPWEGIEPVEGTWTEEPAADEQPPPSRLLFTLGDEARADGSSSPAPEPETTKQRRTLLGRLKG